MGSSETQPLDDSDESCEFCVGMEEFLVEAAIEYRAKGWDPGEGPHDRWRFGYTPECTECGRWFDREPAIAAYVAADGPAFFEPPDDAALWA